MEVAAELGLDARRWTPRCWTAGTCWSSTPTRRRAAAIGVTGTPTYVIGGERLDGGQGQEGLRERIQEIVDGLLGRLSAPHAQPSGLSRWVCTVR